MSKDTIKVEFADVFRGLGNLGKYRITFKDDLQVVVHPAQKLPHSLYSYMLDRLKKCLKANLQCCVLKKVTNQSTGLITLL